MLCSGVFLVSGCHSASLPAVTLMQTAVGFSFALAVPASELLFFFFKPLMNFSLALVPRMQEVSRLAFCWAAVASHWP